MIDLKNNIWIFGCNEYWKLGLGDKKNINVPTQIVNFKVRQIYTGEDHTAMIDLEDNIWTFGDNKYGQPQCLECA
jgi:alpha-tubulin suppressor-like RCC1 family protein